MITCEICGKPAWVHVTEVDGSKHECCMDCQNDKVAALLGVDHFKDYIRTYTYKRHTFNIQQMIYATGIQWQAQEETDKEHGYYFALNAPFDEDPHESLQELYRRIRHGVSNKYLTKGEYQYKYFLKFDKGIGRIECEESGERDHPNLVIDGKKVTWDEFGLMISTCEGFNLKFRIDEPGNDDGNI